ARVDRTRLAELLTALAALLGCAQKLRNLVAENGDLDISTLSDLLRVIEADSLIPAAPAPSYVATLNGSDIGEIDTALSAAKAMMRAQEELRQLPDLSELPDAALGALEKFAQTNIPSGLLGLTPKQLESEAREAVQRKNELIAAIDDLAPVLQ